MDNDSSNETAEAEAKAVEEDAIRRMPVYTKTSRLVSVQEIADGVIWSSGNWRKEIDLKRREQEFWIDMKKRGQTDSMVCRENDEPNGDGTIETGQGHTRLRSVKYGIRTEGIVAVTAAFPQGFMVDLVEGLTDAEFESLKLDNANSENMGTGVQGQLDWTNAAFMLIRKGVSRANIALQLEAQTEKLFPKDKDKGKGEELVGTRTRLKELASEVAILREELAAALKDLDGQPESVIKLATSASDKLIAKNQTEITRLVKHVDYLIVEIRKGTMDRLTNHWNGGPYLDYLLYQKAHGSRDPDAPEGLRVEKMTFSIKGKGISGIVAQCGSAARKDLKVPQGFISPAQRERVIDGPEFKAIWKKFRDHADREKPAKKETLKAMPAKDMVTEAASRQSEGFRFLTRQHAGLEKREDATSIALLQEADALLQVAEVLAEHHEEFWREQCLSRFVAFEKARKEAASKALSGDAETEAETVTETAAEEPVAAVESKPESN